MKRVLPAKRVLKSKLQHVTIYNIDYGSNIIVAPENKIYIVDAGTGRIGEDIVLFIQRNFPNVTKIERIFITHYHFNHVEGIPHIINSFEVGSIHSSGTYSADTRSSYATRDPIAEENLLQAIEDFNIPHTYHKKGDSFIDEHLKFDIWSPLEKHYDPDGRTDNPNGPTGMIVRFEFGNASFVFGGDVFIPKDVREIWQEIGNVSSTGFAWPHHGDFATAQDDIINPMNLSVVTLENIGSAVNTMNYLENKGISHTYLGDGINTVRLFKDGSFEILDA